MRVYVIVELVSRFVYNFHECFGLKLRLTDSVIVSGVLLLKHFLFFLTGNITLYFSKTNIHINLQFLSNEVLFSVVFRISSSIENWFQFTVSNVQWTSVSAFVPFLSRVFCMSHHMFLMIVCSFYVKDEGWLMGVKEDTRQKGVFPENFTRRI